MKHSEPSFVAGLPGFQDNLVLVKRPGQPGELRMSLAGRMSADKGMFDVSAQVDEGDLVEQPDPRGSGRVPLRRVVSKVTFGGVRGGPEWLNAVWATAAAVSHARNIYNISGPVGAVGPGATMSKGGDINITGNITAGNGGDAYGSGTGGPGGSINLRAGDGANAYSLTNPAFDKEAFFRDLLAAIEAGKDDPEMKADATTLVAKAKTAPTWDVAAARIKSALGLLTDGAKLLSLMHQQGILT